MEVLKIHPLRSKVEVKAKAEIIHNYGRSRSSSMDNFRFLAQKLAKLWQF